MAPFLISYTLFIHKYRISISLQCHNYIQLIILCVISQFYYVNLTEFADDTTQMSDYYGDFLSEETHM